MVESGAPPPSITVVAVDDDPTTMRLLEKHITSAGHRFVPIKLEEVTGDLTEHVVAVASANSAHVVVCDLNLPGPDNRSSVTYGLAILRRLHAVTGAHVIAISGAVDDAALSQLKAFKVSRGFSKDSRTMYQDLTAEINRLATLPKRR